MRFMKRPLEGACLGKRGRFVSHPRGGECSPHALHPSHCPRLAPWTIKRHHFELSKCCPEPVLLKSSLCRRRTLGRAEGKRRSLTWQASPAPLPAACPRGGTRTYRVPIKSHNGNSNSSQVAALVRRAPLGKMPLLTPKVDGYKMSIWRHMLGTAIA